MYTIEFRYKPGDRVRVPVLHNQGRVLHCKISAGQVKTYVVEIPRDGQLEAHTLFEDELEDLND